MIRRLSVGLTLGMALSTGIAGADDPPPERAARPVPRAAVRRSAEDAPAAKPARRSRRPSAAELAAAARVELEIILPLPPPAAAARSAFFDEIRKAESNAEQLVFAHGIAYAEKLRQLQYALQIDGRLADLIPVHDEIQRFQMERKPPAPSPAMEPAELRLLAEEYVRLLRATQLSNDVHVARASADYIRQLAVLGRSPAGREDPGALLLLDAERDRLLTNGAIRKAVAGSAGEPDASTDDTIATDMTEREFNDVILRLYRPTNESADAMAAYSIDVGMTEDGSAMVERKTTSGRGVASSRSGKLAYQFRATVTGRAREVPAGSRIVAEYFARSMTDNAREYVTSEEAILPAIYAGESHTVDLKGFVVTQSVSVSGSTSGLTRSYSGTEFYGIIVSLLSPRGVVVMQRFFPQHLSRHLSATPGIR